MAATGTAFVDWVASAFATAGAGTTAAGAVDASAIGATAAPAAAGAGEIAAGTATAVGTGVGGTTITAGGALTAAGTAAEVAQGVAALNPKGGPVVPQPLQTPQADQQVLNAEQQNIARKASAGGLFGTTGTPGGEQGAILAPATMGQKSLLGG